MNRKTLFKNLNRLCLEMDELYNINSGGCCYVAATLAENLERFNIPFSVIVYDLRGLHYAIKVSDRYINRCDYSCKEITKILDITSKELFKYYYNYNRWNTRYSRRWNLIVNTRIKHLFNIYENSRT